MEKQHEKVGKAGQNILTLAVILGLFLYTPALGFAENTDGPGDRPNQGRFQKYIDNHPEAKDHFDRNDDGRVDKRERKMAHKEWVENHQNSDQQPSGPWGRPGEGEGQGQGQGRFQEFLENHPEFAEKADRNGDGIVDETERKQARKFRQERREDRWSENHPGAADRMDRNDDGDIDRFERRQAGHVRHERREDRWSENHPKAADRMDRNDDGDINRVERKKAHQVWDRKHDNNPPGRAGGAGTNWENPRGPKGGPGASPDRKGWGRDRDNNPPGRAGGAGTNWENPRGPKGGPGASPDRKAKKR